MLKREKIDCLTKVFHLHFSFALLTSSLGKENSSLVRAFCPGHCKFPEAVANHFLHNFDGNPSAAIMYLNRLVDPVWEDHASSCTT